MTKSNHAEQIETITSSQKHDQSGSDDEHIVELENTGRRKFIGYMLKGSSFAVALHITSGAIRPQDANARLLGIPELADELDLTDLLLISGDPFYYDYLIKITNDNRVRFELPRMEVGQGILTAAMMILAEELDVEMSSIDATLSPAEIRRATGQITGGSHAVTSLWDPLRKVAAALLHKIKLSAAVHFGISVNEINTENGFAIDNNGSRIAYSELTAGVEGRNDAARLAKPKDPSQYKIIGTPQKRADARDIVTGKLDFAMDLDIPDAMPTVVARPPSLGGCVITFDDSEAIGLPGVLAIKEVPLDVDANSSGVAVVARSFGEAFRARDALNISWSVGAAEHLSDAEVIEQLRAINLPTLPKIPLATDSVGGEFIFPYLAHAPMETMTAVADATGSKIRVWTGAKTPLAAQAKIARDLGVLPTDVEVNVIQSGGSFGRRLFFDAAVEGARISQIVNRPIKLMFTRQDDTKFGRARPLSLHNVKATYTRGFLIGKKVLSFDHRAATAELDLEHGFGDGITALGGELAPAAFSQTVWHSTQLVQYKFGVTSLLLNEKKFVVPTSSWRGIYSGTAAVANEIVVDELARAMNEDECQFRLQMLDDERSKAVLRKVSQEGNWGRRMKKGRAQGLGLHKEYKSRAAVLVELQTFKNPEKECKVTKIVVALDVNRVLNPTGLEAQVIGAATDAITYMIRTSLHLDNGAIRESSYGDFEIARMRNTPPDIEVHFMPPNGETPGGAGELVVPAAAAAIANAFARATGIAPRRFPLRDFYPEG